MANNVRHFLQSLGAKKFATAAYKPSSNGSVERFHAFLGHSLAHAVKESQEDWDKHIDSALFAYRTTPFEILYGREPNLPIDLLLGTRVGEKPILNEREHGGASRSSKNHV